MIDEAKSDAVELLLHATLERLAPDLQRLGLDVKAAGLSLFLIEKDLCTSQHLACSADAAQIGEFAPEWPFILTADLLAGPQKAFEDACEEVSPRPATPRGAAN